MKNRSLTPFYNDFSSVVNADQSCYHFSILVGALQFMMTTRGRLQLLHEGYRFYMERTNGNKVLWKCNMYHKTRCAGRCHTINKCVTWSSQNHNHTPDTQYSSGTVKITDVKMDKAW